MNILIPILLGITWIISLITMALALSLDDQISSLRLDINRVAFFKIYNIYTSQLPDLQGLCFALLFILSAYKIYEYKQYKQEFDRSTKDTEQRYLLTVKTIKTLTWDSIIITQAFIMTTIGLSFIDSIILCQGGLKESQNLFNKYNNHPAMQQEDQNTLYQLQDQFAKYEAIIALNAISLALLGGQIITTVYSKFRLKI
ncbi:hypothetical protein pb186bvf_016159 [Paramecium bursaria]